MTSSQGFQELTSTLLELIGNYFDPVAICVPLSLNHNFNF